jgi:hypothetical protein
MLRSDLFTLGIVTFYLTAYCVLLQFEATIGYAEIMLAFSPVLICWMVYMVLKFGKYSGPELGHDEFVYQDKKKDELGVF